MPQSPGNKGCKQEDVESNPSKSKGGTEQING